jgi:aryl-alcohol dehydrogenase-like predicted oxidoreductase
MTFGQQNTQAEAFEQLDYAFDKGINFIDTAELYPVPPRAETYTRTETIVGNWLATQQRDKVILASKVAGPNRNMPWIRGGPQSVDKLNIQQAIDESLQRLQTDYIDLYQIHWPARNVPMFGQFRYDPSKEIACVSIHDQLAALAEQVQAGKVRYIGVSNETPWGLMEFLRIAKEYALPTIVSTQNAYSLINRTFEAGLTEIAYREQVGLLAYSPLAFGHLTAKYQQTPHGAGRVTEFPGFGQRYEKPTVQPSVAAYTQLARKHGLTPAQLALSFVYHQWFTTSTIIGATTMTQLKENIGAWSMPLSEEILSEIDALQLLYMNPAP